MFIGAVPKEVIAQILDTVPLGSWGSVFVGCSGSFRFDQAVKQRYGVRVFSNDVSLVSCSVGALAKGREFALAFKGELAFVEELLAGATFFERVAAVWVVLTMAKFKGNNAFARAHYEHYRRNFAVFHADAKKRLQALLDALSIEEFYAGDFLAQIPRAREAGGGFACFAPTYKGGYERLYRFLEANVEWPRPEYGVWDPAKLADLVGELEASGLRHVVISDQRLPGREPATAFYGTNKPVYTYTNDRASASLRRRSNRAETFKYEPLDTTKLRADSLCQLVEIDNAKLMFLRQVYLSKNIDAVPGTLAYAVFLDGMLAGAFSYTLEKWGNKASSIYLLSDFATSRERRVSKLIPMLASCREAIKQVDRKFIIRVQSIWTTAFTDKPVSMKYRGVFTLHSRKPGQLQYRSTVREQTAQEAYREWFRKSDGTAVRQDRDPALSAA